MTIDPGTLAAWAGVVLGLATYHFGVISKLQQDIKEMQTKVDVFWLGLSKKMAEMLISPHTPELDEVLRRFVEGHPLRLDELHFAVEHLEKERVNCLKYGNKEKAFWYGMMKDRFEAEIAIKEKRSVLL